MVEIPATGQCFRRNCNFIKPRQSEKNSNSKRIPILQLSNQPSQFHWFPKSLQQSSKQLQVAKLPVQWMPFPQYPLHCRIRILHLEGQGHLLGPPKEFPHPGLDYQKINSSCTDISVQTILFQKGRCCDMGQNDTIGKIELIPLSVLSTDNTNCKNDIQ